MTDPAERLLRQLAIVKAKYRQRAEALAELDRALAGDPDLLDELIEQRTQMNPEFPRLLAAALHRHGGHSPRD